MSEGKVGFTCKVVNGFERRVWFLTLKFVKCLEFGEMEHNFKCLSNQEKLKTPQKFVLVGTPTSSMN